MLGAALTLIWRTLLFLPFLRAQSSRIYCNCIGLLLHLFLCVAERAKFSTKSRSSSCVQVLHWCRCSFLFFIILWMSSLCQALANRNKKGDSKQPCLTPVCTWKASVSSLHGPPSTSFFYRHSWWQLRSSLVFRSVSTGFPVHIAERLLAVHKLDTEQCISLRRLL